MIFKNLTGKNFQGREYAEYIRHIAIGSMGFSPGIIEHWVTLGGAGSYLLREDGSQEFFQADPHVTVVDTTAAGADLRIFLNCVFTGGAVTVNGICILL